MYIMVLNDGETWTELSGCKIIRIDTDLNDDTDDWRIKEAYNGENTMLLNDQVITEFK